MLVKAKKFTDIALHSIPKSGWTNFLFYDNSQSVKSVLTLLYKEDKVPGRKSPVLFHHPSEILRMSDPLLFCKPEGSSRGDPHHLSVEWTLLLSSGN